MIVSPSLQCPSSQSAGLLASEGGRDDKIIKNGYEICPNPSYLIHITSFVGWWVS